MPLRPETLAMTVVLGLMTALGPLSTDMYLPSLPAIARAFDASTASTQLTLSLFLLGFACGQVIYGPVADRYGRRPVLLAGFALQMSNEIQGHATLVAQDFWPAFLVVGAVAACALLMLRQLPPNAGAELAGQQATRAAAEKSA